MKANVCDAHGGTAPVGVNMQIFLLSNHACLLTCVDADDVKYLFSVLRIEQVQSQGKWTTNSHSVWQFDLNISIKTCMTSHHEEPHFTATPAAPPNVHASALFPYESCFYNSQLFLHHIPCNNPTHFSSQGCCDWAAQAGRKQEEGTNSCGSCP